ncbi:hypothetical protein JCM8208_004738 [Rhodotorula glutinis]
MCFASTSLFFGITVPALDLVLAASAFASVRQTLVAIHLIIARKSSGCLDSTIENGKVGAIPIEVWELIKKELFHVAYAARYDEIEDSYYPDLSTDDYEYYDQDGPLTFENLLSSSWAFDFYQEDGGLDYWTDGYDKEVDELLEYFDLCRATESLIREPDGDSWSDWEAAWTIGIPPVGSRSQSPSTLDVWIGHDTNEAYSVGRILPSAFDLPKDAKTHFRRFLASFPHLSPNSTGIGAIDSLASTRTRRKVPARQSRSARAAARAPWSEPAWMLSVGGQRCR